MQNQTGNTDFPENANQFFYESFSEVLSKAIGYFVVCEFLIGNAIVEKSGILYAAGVNFVTLENPANGSFTVCDIYSLKFATFYDTTEVPEEFCQYHGCRYRSQYQHSARQQRLPAAQQLSKSLFAAPGE